MGKTTSKSKIAFAVVIALLIATFSAGIIVQANVTGSFAVTSSAANLTVGQEFTITVTISTPAPGMSAYQFHLHYDSSRVTFVPGGSNGIIMRTWGEASGGNPTQRTETFRFRAIAAGNPEFSIGTGYGMVLANNAHTSGGGLTMSRTATTVSIISAGSDDSTLRSLTVPGHNLSPAFNPNTTTYTVNLPHDVTAVAVNAQSNQSDGRHTISAIPNPIPVGTTTVTIRSYAPNGTHRVYTLRLVRAEAGPPPAAGPLEIEIGEDKYIVTRDLAGVEIPDGFETKTMELAGEEITAVSGVARDLTLVHLTDRTGIAQFFVYQEGTLFPFVVIELPYQNLIVLPSQTSLPGYSSHRYMMVLGQFIGVYYSSKSNTQNENGSNDANDANDANDNQENDFALLAYTAVEEEYYPELVLFYAMNWQGASSWYRFDTVDSTIQRYLPTELYITEQPVYVTDCEHCDQDFVSENPNIEPRDDLVYQQLQANISGLEDQLRTRNEVTIIIIATLGIISVILAGVLAFKCVGGKKPPTAPEESTDFDDNISYGYTRPEAFSYDSIDTSLFDSIDTSLFDGNNE